MHLPDFMLLKMSLFYVSNDTKFPFTNGKMEGTQRVKLGFACATRNILVFSSLPDHSQHLQN